MPPGGWDAIAAAANAQREADDARLDDCQIEIDQSDKGWGSAAVTGPTGTSRSWATCHRHIVSLFRRSTRMTDAFQDSVLRGCARSKSANVLTDNYGRS